MHSRWAKIAFWGAVVVTLWFALYPQPPQLLPTDKDQHVLAFGVLTVLALAAYGPERWLVATIALATFGGAIELLQLIPVLHRDADVVDWLTDCAAIAVPTVMTLTLRRIMLARSGP